jgi:hypothetical protein
MEGVKLPEGDCSLNLTTTLRKLGDLFWKAKFNTVPIHPVHLKDRMSRVLLDSDGSSYAVYARYYNSAIGSGVEIRYYPQDGSACPARFLLIPLIRSKKGYVPHGTPTNDSLNALQQAKSFVGTTKTKKKRRDPKAEQRMRWWTPQEHRIVHRNGRALTTAKLRMAICQGFCVVDPISARVYKDLSNPDIELETYFFVEVQDRWCRNFILLVPPEADRFMVAIEHNKDCVKPTGDENLFATGNNPLCPGDLGPADLELVQAAIGMLSE